MYPAGNGGSGVVIIRLSGFVVKNIPLPKPSYLPGDPFVYDGNAHTGIVEFFAYTLTGTPIAKNADVYTVTATIPDGKPYFWADWHEGDPEEKKWGPRTVSWEINPLPVNVPRVNANPPRKNYFTFGDEARKNEEEKLAIDGDLWFLAKDRPGYPGETCATTNNASGNKLPYCTLTGHRAINAGSYTFIATLVTTDPQGNFATNFVWSAAGDDRTGARSIGWSIKQAENAITSLSLANWQEGTAAKEPARDWQWSGVVAKNPRGEYPNKDEILFQCRKLGEKGDWPDPATTAKTWNELKPTLTEAGRYELRGWIRQDSNHTNPSQYGNWCEAFRTCTFMIWRHPSEVFANYVDIYPTGSSVTSESSGLADFPVLVRLKEAVRNSAGAISGGIPGFSYSEVRNDGLDLRFISVAASSDKDELLPFEVDTWDPRGESLVWVRVPKMWKGAKFRMYWRIKENAVLPDDFYASDTWANGYVGVWHLNAKDGSRIRNSTAIGSALDAKGEVEILTADSAKPSKVGNSMYAVGDVIVPDYQPFMPSATSPFTVTGWYRGDSYQTGGTAKTPGRNNYMFTGKKDLLQFDGATGWCITINNNVTYYLPYSSGNNNFGNKTVSDLTKNWHQLVFQMPATGSSQTGVFYFDGANKSTSGTKTVTTNALDYLLVGQTCAADEVRLSSVARPDSWVKAEYESVNKENYCTFGLVNQLQADGTRAWVNWWSVEPWSNAKDPGTENGRYWMHKPDTPYLDQAKVDAYKGKLAQVVIAKGTSTPTVTCGESVAAYFKMPGEDPVDFPEDYGSYQIKFAMKEDSSTDFPGKHILYDGGRIVDVEIIAKRPEPIAPGGADGRTASGRVLLANDYDISDLTNSVAGQSYWRTAADDGSVNPFWEHGGDNPPELGVNLHDGSKHWLRLVEQEGAALVTNDLWTLTDVYFGNMMTNDDTVAATVALSNRWNELPWSRKSKAAFTPEKWVETGDLTNRSEVGQLVMRNIEDAEIRSRVFTNGIGTIYFDAVNVYAGSDVNAADYRLAVEVATPEEAEKGEDGEWTRVELMPLLVSGSSVTPAVAAGELALLNVKNGGNLVTTAFKFYRVYAKVGNARPLVFRIRRLSSLVRTDAEGVETWSADDPDGFILIDNVLASQPTDDPGAEGIGYYDKTLRGKQVLGQEGAFTVAYPDPTDVFCARMKLLGTGTDKVTSARVHYRWRYVNGRFDPAVVSGRENWNEASFDLAGGGIVTSGELAHPPAVGDIEYWFDLTAIVPYYSYFDYSGLTLSKPTGGYTEEPPKNRPVHSSAEYLPATQYPSGGTNWFVRLREGTSPHRRMTLKFKELADVEMELLYDHVWRGYLKTMDAISDGVSYRVEVQTWPVPGDVSVPVVTNRWYAKDDVTVLPTSAILETNGTTNDWARIPLDATTGYLMFQIDDDTKSISIVHGDYQDFNAWDDAKNDDVFAGNASDLGKRGVSPKKQEFDEGFMYERAGTLRPWDDTPSASTNWTETFEAGAKQEYADYTAFGSATTLNGWKVGPGMFVNAWYRYATAIGGYVQRALQMEGCGKGWIQFPTTLSARYAPRGIGTISFRTRLAQSISPFTDVSYADPFDGDTVVNQNYALVALVAFDTLENKGFSGNASVSLFAYYHDRRGCYELRLEQIGANVSGSSVTGPSNARRLSLYRWKVDRTTGTTASALLGYKDITFTAVKTAGETGSYTPLYLSCQNESGATVLKAGIYRNDTGNDNTAGKGFAYNAAINGLSDRYYYNIVYRDTKEPLAGGTYGVLTANSPGVVLRPHVTHEPIATAKTEKDTIVTEGENNKVTFPPLYSCEADIRDVSLLEPWITTYGRMETFWNDGYRWGLKASATSQKLAVKVAPRGEKNPTWETVRTVDVTSFGSAPDWGTETKIRLDRTADYDVRFESAAALSDPRTDIVIDSLALTQWRGCSYGDPDTEPFIADDDGYGWRTNFTFSSGWVKDGAVLLSAKRTSGWTPGSKASGLRSPLMDGAGTPKRGIGLGVISFSYRNAQENAKLQVQIATNGVGSSALGYDTIDEAKWTTVSNVDFSAMSPAERRSGNVAMYLGLHGVKGLMRVILDPSVVEQVSPKDWLDEKKYGEVEITHLHCRDEPAIDMTAWTGWNMQTTDRFDRQFLTDNMMFDSANGLSLGLNRSTTENVEDDPETYKRQMPYVETPAFLSNTVGEVTFRARKYGASDADPTAEVVLYGGTYNPVTRAIDWKCSSTDLPVARFAISNTTYTTYSYKTKPGDGYHAFRLGVAGIKTVDAETRGNSARGAGVNPERVLIDEVLVSEAIRPRVGFRSCLPIRNALMSTERVPGAGTRDEQPILGDAWSVQAEIEVQLLPDEIDLTTPGHEPRVLFYWFSGESPWGFAAWRDQAIASANPQTAGRAELAPADGETMVFRGSYLSAPGAVVMADLSETKTYGIYQYAAEVVYWDKNGNCITGAMAQAEWTRPEWYAPLDLNRKNGGGVLFSAYNILERIAPGRAWINEANVFDGRDENYEYPAVKNQYVEIALPIGQSLDGWRLKYISNNLTTNLLCVFGMDGVATGKTANEKDSYVFLTVQSPATKKAGTLDPSAGEVDGTWYQFDPDDANAELDQTHPIGFQLIRPSGIIAQEIVMSGTNTWAGTAYEDRYSSEKRVEELNEFDPEKQWLLAGDEYKGGDETTSLGVTNVDVAAERTSAMEPQEMWTVRGRHSPGRINDGQVIPPGWAIYPSGDMAIVYATVEGPHIRQTAGGLTNVTSTIMLVTKKDGEGTNIVYNLDTWYEIDKITENDVVKATGKPDGYVFAAGKGTQDSVVRVKATARPRSDLRDKYGLTPQNRYTEAVIDWLEKGHRLHGEAFEHPGNIDLPIIRDLAGNFITNLTLTETYWFDIDPTGSNWCFRAGTSKSPYEVEAHFSKGPDGKPVYDPTGTADYLIKTNVRMEVMMAITNEATVGKWAGKSWSPYVLRGIEPGSDSQQYARGETNRWESVNFKPTGDIQNGMPLRERWVPLRYFVFTEGSFDANHRSTVEVPAPYSSDSLGVNYGWLDFIGCPVFYSWSIDGRVAPVAIETLAPTNTITW